MFVTIVVSLLSHSSWYSLSHCVSTILYGLLQYSNCLVTVQDVSHKDSDGVIQLHFVGKFGGFTVALETSSQENNLLLASLKGLVSLLQSLV